jgi:hypothetical protein
MLLVAAGLHDRAILSRSALQAKTLSRWILSANPTAFAVRGASVSELPARLLAAETRLGISPLRRFRRHHPHGASTCRNGRLASRTCQIPMTSDPGALGGRDNCSQTVRFRAEVSMSLGEPDTRGASLPHDRCPFACSSFGLMILWGQESMPVMSVTINPDRPWRVATCPQPPGRGDWLLALSQQRLSTAPPSVPRPHQYRAPISTAPVRKRPVGHVTAIIICAYWYLRVIDGAGLACPVLDVQVLLSCAILPAS